MYIGFVGFIGGYRDSIYEGLHGVYITYIGFIGGLYLQGLGVSKNRPSGCIVDGRNLEPPTKASDIPRS